jgi:hypothetical protein
MAGFRHPGVLGNGSNGLVSVTSNAAMAPAPEAAGFGGGGGGFFGAIGMLRNLILSAVPAQAASSSDAISFCSTKTRRNFALLGTPLGKSQLRRQIAKNAKLLGGQNRVNNVIRRLGAGNHLAAAMLGAIYAAAQAEQIDSRFLAATIFTELKPSYRGGTIDTYHVLGMDFFLHDFPTLVKKGYLPQDFRGQFRATSEHIPNEHYDVVQVAKFRSMVSAFTALAAMLKDRRDRMLADLAEWDIGRGDLTQDELDYWTYVYYNSSHPKHNLDDEIKRNIKHLGKSSAKVPTRFIQAPTSVDESRGNAQRMLAIKEILRWSGMEDPSDPHTLESMFFEESL